MTVKQDKSMKVTGLRTRAEELLRITKDDVAALSVEDLQQLVHELQVHEIELEMQNEVLRRIQVELEAARDRYAELYKGAPTGSLTLDPTGLILEANLPACTLLGVTQHDLIGTPLIRFIDRKDQATYLHHVRELCHPHIRQACDVDLVGQDGVHIAVRFESVVVLDHAGQGALARISLTDITERKRLEAQKMDAVGQLAGGVAHEFNNLLTIINGYSTLLLDQLHPEDPRHEMAIETLQAGERAAELTKQLLAFSRKQVFTMQLLNLNDSLRTIRSKLSRLLGEGVTLTMDLAPDLWSINGDTRQLDQVTMNLAVNARDAMLNGGDLTIATRNLAVTSEASASHRIVPPGDYVQVSVRDSGCGMSPETLSHLFEPFYTTKEVGKGTGLGLATVYGIVMQSQGYIVADSALGHGTTFHLYYPRAVAVSAMAETLPVGRRICSETLLVVEDHDTVRDLVVQALKGYGYRVIEAANGEDALRVAASLPEPVQALVTDVIMPHLSGPELAERLRQTWPGLRVLFMSGYTAHAKPVFLNEPGTAFIQKPFLPKDLASRLRDILDLSPGKDEAKVERRPDPD